MLMQRELVDIATQLGATVHADLMSEVTHLIARAPGSEKYHAAVRFHMRVVRPEWLYAVREAWLAGEDVWITNAFVRTDAGADAAGGRVRAGRARGAACGAYRRRLEYVAVPRD